MTVLACQRLKEILNLINSFAPANTALSYDNTGLLLGDAEQTVTKAVVCLDATPDAIEFAKENNAGLIITHHPIIFDGLKSCVFGKLVLISFKHFIVVGTLTRLSKSRMPIYLITV